MGIPFSLLRKEANPVPYPAETLPPLILLGFMGSGKSTVGALLARTLKIPFYDLDARIEEEVGKRIPEIFAQEGEERFREYETRALQGFRKVPPPYVLAPGGGAVLREENWQIFEELKGMVIWLHLPPEEAFARVQRSDRPLLKSENPWETFRSLYNKRLKFYARASYRVNANQPPEKVVEEILAFLKGKE